MNKVKSLFFFSIILLIVYSCRSDDKQSGKETTQEPSKNRPVENYVENEIGDSILYFKDFDLYTFKGKESVQVSSLTYPFVKMIYRLDTLLLKAYYSNGKTHKLSFHKLNGHWATSSWGRSDGANVHTSILFTGKGFYEFRYLDGNLYSVNVTVPSSAIAQSRYYQSFDWHDMNIATPDPDTLHEDNILRNSERRLTTDYFIRNDSVGYTYNSSERVYRDGRYKEYRDEGGGTGMVGPLLEGSVFYTLFIGMKQGKLR